jgi:colicin import membrane protein
MTAPTPPVDTAPAPEATPAAPPAPVPSPPPAAPPAQPASEAATPAEGEPAEGETSEASKLRRENASWRTKLREQEQAAAALTEQKTAAEKQAADLKAMLDGIAKALNPEAANEPPDPAKLAEQLATAQAERETLAAEKDAQIRDLTVRAALPGILSKAGADPDLTLAVLTAGGVLSKLDPSAESFATDLASAVAAAVEANPKLKVAPVAVRSGAEIPGRSGGSDQVTREQLSRMSSAEIDKARVDGRLKSLLGGG